MTFSLRPYQEKIIADTRGAFADGNKSVLLVMPTGAGKTATCAWMIKSALSKGLPTWFLCHRKELVGQASKTFDRFGIPYGIIASGSQPTPYKPVQVCSIQTLVNRVDRLKKPGLVVYDEAHHMASASWSKVKDMLPDSFHLGLTATPERLDGKGLADYFQTMVLGPDAGFLIENGFLSKYRVFAPTTVNTSSVSTRAGDFAKDELSALMDKPSITGDAVEHYLKLAAGKRALCFCVSVEHSKHVVEQFRANGVAATHVDGTTPPKEREHASKDFADGKIFILSNVELFGEGYDVPAAEVAILLRPTQSLALHLQQIGRVLRPAEGKEHAIILDHVGNCLRHGLPDTERQWSLQGRPKKAKGKKQETSESVRQCPKCYGVMSARLLKCDYCSHVFEVKGREIEKKDGQLVEVDLRSERFKTRKEQGRAQTFQELVNLGRQRGYKNPFAWANIIIQHRLKKEAASSGNRD